jgi:hypothetical protein
MIGPAADVSLRSSAIIGAAPQELFGPISVLKLKHHRQLFRRTS